MSRLRLPWEAVLALLLIAELAVFGAINPRFVSPASLLFGTSDFVHVGLIAVPLTLVIIAGGIDVSFAATVGLGAVVLGIANAAGLPIALSVLLAVATGTAAGAFNAGMIELTRLQPLVITLGSLYLFQGLATVLSGTVGAGGFEGIGGFPAGFTALGYARVLGVPLPLAVFLAISVAGGITLHLGRYGRAALLTGQNEAAARHAGIAVGRVRAIGYALTGAAAALAGVMLTAYFGSARVDLGSATLLPAITACVLGGASIYGGQGSILGTILATFIIGYLTQGLQAAGVPSQISSALSGALLVLVVGLRIGVARLADRLSIRRAA